MYGWQNDAEQCRAVGRKANEGESQAEGPDRL